MPDASNVVGVILAGGMSLRMGQHKAELIYQQQSLLEHAKQCLTQAGIDETIVSSPDTMPDRIPNKGPIGGIHTALERYQQHSLERILFIPVDMPLLTPSIIQELLSHPSANHYQGEHFPLVLPLTPCTLKTVENQINSNQLALHALLSALNATSLPIPHEHQPAFTNVNTPKDYQALPS